MNPKELTLGKLYRFNASSALGEVYYRTYFNIFSSDFVFTCDYVFSDIVGIIYTTDQHPWMFLGLRKHKSGTYGGVTGFELLTGNTLGVVWLNDIWLINNIVCVEEAINNGST